MGERLPLYDEVAARLLFDPTKNAHEWRESPLPADDRFSHITPEWNENAEMALGEDADAWTGVTRYDLPVTERPREGVDVAGAVEALVAGGIRMPNELITAAVAEKTGLAVAAAILMKETGGGRNIYGHDPVITGNFYVKGGPVTRENYLAYRAAMKSGRIGRQGVGPCQATSAQYQDTADLLGGCWDPVANMRSGFRGMNALISKYGVRQGARRYNGSGPAAERYGEDFEVRVNNWRKRLAGVTLPSTNTLTTSEEDELPSPEDVWRYPVQDRYTANPNDTIPAGEILGWGVAHAAAARDRAETAIRKIDELTDALRRAGYIT